MDATEKSLVLTGAQLAERLRGDSQSELYGILCGYRFRDLESTVEKLGTPRHDRLWPGMLTPEQAAESPLLCRVVPASDLEAWLIQTMTKSEPLLGVLAYSRAGYLAVRAHARELCRAGTLAGEDIRLDWMDPEVLDLLLPGLDPSQSEVLLGPLDGLALPGSPTWRLISKTSAWHTEIQAITLREEAAA